MSSSSISTSKSMSTSQSPSPQSTILLTLPYHQFSLHPITTIKQHLTPNVTILSYKQSSIVTYDQTVLVEINYISLPINPFLIYYIPITDIKHLIPNSEKYICSINDCQVKLVNPKLSHFKTYLPIKVRSSMLPLQDQDDFYIDDELKTNLSTPIQYFGTTVIQPMNAFCTPLSLLNKDLNSPNSFDLELPPILYPNNFKPSFISESDNLKNYKQCLVSAKLLNNVDEVIEINNTNNITYNGTTAYVINFSLLMKMNNSIKGIILIQPKRIPEKVLWYPTNSYEISKDELHSIDRFLEFDRINYFNYQYLKN